MALDGIRSRNPHNHKRTSDDARPTRPTTTEKTASKKAEVAPAQSVRQPTPVKAAVEEQSRFDVTKTLTAPPKPPGLLPLPAPGAPITSTLKSPTPLPDREVARQQVRTVLEKNGVKADDATLDRVAQQVGRGDDPAQRTAFPNATRVEDGQFVYDAKLDADFQNRVLQATQKENVKSLYEPCTDTPATQATTDVQSDKAAREQAKESLLFLRNKAKAIGQDGVADLFESAASAIDAGDDDKAKKILASIGTVAGTIKGLATLFEKVDDAAPVLGKVFGALKFAGDTVSLFSNLAKVVVGYDLLNGKYISERERGDAIFDLADNIVSVFEGGLTIGAIFGNSSCAALAGCPLLAIPLIQLQAMKSVVQGAADMKAAIAEYELRRQFGDKDPDAIVDELGALDLGGDPSWDADADRRIRANLEQVLRGTFNKVDTQHAWMDFLRRNAAREGISPQELSLLLTEPKIGSSRSPLERLGTRGQDIAEKVRTLAQRFAREQKQLIIDRLNNRA